MARLVGVAVVVDVVEAVREEGGELDLSGSCFHHSAGRVDAVLCQSSGSFEDVKEAGAGAGAGSAGGGTGDDAAPPASGKGVEVEKEKNEFGGLTVGSKRLIGSIEPGPK